MGRTWQEVSKNKDAIVRSFKKCRLSLDLSGLENNEINHQRDSFDVEFHLEVDDSDNDIYDNGGDEFEAESQITQ